MELFLKEGASLPTKGRQGGVVRWRDKNEVEEKEVDGKKKKSKVVQASLKKVRPAVKRQWRSL